MKHLVISILMASVAALFPAAMFGQTSEPADSTQDTTATAEEPVPESSVIDEVIWVVGDEAILKSDVEALRMQGLAEGISFGADPDCAIPEQLAVQKLFLHQAAIDSIEVTETEIANGVNQQINHWITLAGSQEKLEEYRKETVQQMRNDLHDEYRNQLLIQGMKKKIVEDIKVSPADVRAYFRTLPEDSIPFVPTEVEVEVIELTPKVSAQETERVKDQLREYTRRVQNGETTFSTLARLYSEDPVSARQGGELGMTSRAMLDPAFANAAFNLTDPNKISKIVETEFGYHIIQLIEKRGDKINVRHILLKPKVAQEEIDRAKTRLDTIRANIVGGKEFFGKPLTFEDAATYFSEDKDTRNNRGIMSNLTSDGMTSKFQMKDLPTEVARVVETMQPGDVSQPFELINSKGKTMVAIVKLKSRTPGHRATITEDFPVMKEVVLQKMQDKAITDWVVDKIKHTYIRMADRYKTCNFQYQGWVK